MKTLTQHDNLVNDSLVNEVKNVMEGKDRTINEGILQRAIKSIGDMLGYGVKIEKGVLQDIWDGLKLGAKVALFIEKTKREIVKKLEDGKDKSDKEKSIIYSNAREIVNSINGVEGVRLRDVLNLFDEIESEAKKLGYNTKV